MSTIAERPNLSLFGIETQLLELLSFREDLLADSGMDPAERTESLQATENRIREYVTAEVKKVDNIARYLREFEARAAIAKQEAAREKAREKMWESRHESLKAIVESVMIQTGQKKLEGQGNTLSLRKCPPSVEIAQPLLVPDEYRKLTLEIPANIWYELLRLAGSFEDVVAPAIRITDCEPMKTPIKEALKGGSGVPGCSLRDDKVYLKVS